MVCRATDPKEGGGQSTNQSSRQNKIGTSWRETLMNGISRKEALAKGLKTYFTGNPCSKGHVAERYVNGWGCLECHKKYYQNNRERRKEYDKEYYQNNREYRLEYHKEYYRNNTESISGYHKEYCQNNPEYFKEHHKEYRQSNKAKVNAYVIQRLKHLRRATPSWVDLREIETFYYEAWCKTKETGIPYHVDHIVPIRGRNVRGLHVPWNLQVIPAQENMRKGSRLLEELL